MSEQQSNQVTSLKALKEQPLIGIIFQEKGQEVVRYFTEEADVHAATSAQGIQEALSLAGAWSDLNWDDVEEELRRIRSESRPTPPLSL